MNYKISDLGLGDLNWGLIKRIVTFSDQKLIEFETRVAGKLEKDEWIWFKLYKKASMELNSLDQKGNFESSIGKYLRIYAIYSSLAGVVIPRFMRSIFKSYKKKERLQIKKDKELCKIGIEIKKVHEELKEISRNLGIIIC